MGRDIKELIAKFNNKVVTAALPYDKPVYQKADEKKENEKDPECENESNVPTVPSDNLEETNTLRIGTTAKWTYELDRYSKNAMLIFEGNSSYVFGNPGEDASSHADNMTTKLKETFEKYRFEVEVYKDLNDDEIARTCDQFFQQDFTEYGCVAVILLAKTWDGIVESSHTTNTEYGILRYLSDLMPPTLEGKPKIYIVQTEGFYVVPRARVWSRVPQDALEIRLPVPIVSAPDFRGNRSKVCCLLEHIHEKLNQMADDIDLQTLLQDSVNEFTRNFQLYGLPVVLYSSLTKELRLAKATTPQNEP